MPLPPSVAVATFRCRCHLPLPLPLPLASPIIDTTAEVAGTVHILIVVTGAVDTVVVAVDITVAVSVDITVAPRYHYRCVSLPLPFSVDNTVARTVARRHCFMPVARELCRFLREK